MDRITWLFAGLAAVICALLLVQPGSAAQIVVSGGGGGSIAAGSSNQQILFNNNGVLGGFGSWDGSTFFIEEPVSGDELTLRVINASATADASAGVLAYTNGDAATGPAYLQAGVHLDGSNNAEFTISVAGDSGDAFPTTTVNAPGAVVFNTTATDSYQFQGSVPGDLLELIARNTSTAASANDARIGAETDSDTSLGNATLGLAVHSDGANFARFAISVDGASGNATPDTTFTFPGTAQFTATDFRVSGLTSTGAATGKKVVCVDTATGRLYASSTGTDCSN